MVKYPVIALLSSNPIAFRLFGSLSLEISSSGSLNQQDRFQGMQLQQKTAANNALPQGLSFPWGFCVIASTSGQNWSREFVIFDLITLYSLRLPSHNWSLLIWVKDTT